MKYNILTAPLTLAILLAGTPSFGMDSEILTKTNISKLAPKVEDLSNSLNAIEKWNLVDSLKDRDTNKPISVKKKPKGFEILGDNYTFNTNLPELRSPEFHNTTFSFSTVLRSTNPGVSIQYYDGKNAVNSVPYASRRGEWETLNVDFTVDPNAKFHRFYGAILGTVNNATPSVDLSSVKLQLKLLSDQIPTNPSSRSPEDPLIAQLRLKQEEDRLRVANELRLKEEEDRKEELRLKEEEDRKEELRLKEEADRKEELRLKEEADRKEELRLKEEEDRKGDCYLR